MKHKALLLLTVVTACGLPVLGQDAGTATLTLRPAGQSSACKSQSAPPSGLPFLCPSCIFYGGDVDPNDPNSNAFANGNSLGVPDTATYTAVNVPKGAHGVVTGIVFMEFDDTSNRFDPDIATYDIRTGVSEGNGGVSLASGSGKMAFKFRSQCPFTTYETAVKLASPLEITPGTTYWFNLSPQCTDSGNSYCSGVVGYLENTTHEAFGLHAAAQPAGQMFFNSGYFGYTWANWCDPKLGQNADSCARGSFALMGHH